MFGEKGCAVFERKAAFDAFGLVSDGGDEGAHFLQVGFAVGGGVESAAGFEDTAKLGEGAVYVRDVVEHVIGENPVECGVGKGKGLGVGLGERETGEWRLEIRNL